MTQTKAFRRYIYAVKSNAYDEEPNNLGPAVQSVVSLTSSLRVISLTVLADSIYNIMIYFCWKKCG